jgi:signal transduction histidine kinase/DNA-binding response OmpR family regulator
MSNNASAEIDESSELEALRRISARSIITLTLLALAVVAGLGFSQYAASKVAVDAHLINMAGSQRMLSQRLAKATLRITDADLAVSAAAKAEIGETISLWTKRRGELRHDLDVGGYFINDDAAIALRESLNGHSEAMMAAASRLHLEDLRGTPEMTALVHEVMSHEAPFLSEMDSLVSMIEVAAIQRGSRIRTIVLFTLVVLLVIPMADALLVLRPNFLRLRNVIRRAQQLRHEERKQSKELEELLKRTQAAAEAKGAFMAMMSHELRTPMNGVLGMTSLLLETPLGPEQREYAKTVRTSADALLEILNDILDFSKIESGRIELEKSDFSIRTCVDEALDAVAAKASEKHIEMALLLDDSVPPAVRGDAGRLRQVLVNLVSNGVKFTEQGEVVVHVEGKPSESGGFLLEFHVKDSGIGMDAETQARVFEPFVQADATIARRFGGTGLGLTISRKLSELMGGTLSVKSEPGKGSVFTLMLPVEAAKEPVPEPVKLADTHLLEGATVLIVDDNPTNRVVLKHHLERLNIRVIEAENATAALMRMQNSMEEFSLVITDVRMPKINGFELAKSIRQQRPVPILFFSSVGDLEAQVLARQIGRAEVLLKPLKPVAMQRALRRLIVQRPDSGEQTRPPLFDTTLGERFPLKVLVAEDNPVNQRLLARILEKLGYRADLVGNGLEVLEALKLRDYDVVLLDIQMPEMDGLEAARQIQARWAPNERPQLVALSASVLAQQQQAALAVGISQYLTKPIHIPDLVETLKTVSQRKKLIAAGFNVDHPSSESLGKTQPPPPLSNG